jgi:hypothetical protein
MTEFQGPADHQLEGSTRSANTRSALLVMKKSSDKDTSARLLPVTVAL